MRPALLAVTLLAMAAAPVLASPPGQVVSGAIDSAAQPAPITKKHQRIAAKASAPVAVEVESPRARWHAELDRRLGKEPGEVVSMYNTWTREFFPVDLAAAEAAIRADAVNAFLRCHFTNQPALMDSRLVPTLVEAARHFGSRRIDIVSGFRSPKYNLILRKKGREVARDSQHTHGRAVDFRLHGVPVQRVLAWAKRLRLGGVGFYPASGFVHIDTGRVRTWTGR